MRFRFSGLVAHHFLVSVLNVGIEHVAAQQVLDEWTDVLRPDNSVQIVVDLLDQG